jgi:hypothetical protein
MEHTNILSMVQGNYECWEIGADKDRLLKDILEMIIPRRDINRVRMLGFMVFHRCMALEEWVDVERGLIVMSS